MKHKSGFLEQEIGVAEEEPEDYITEEERQHLLAGLHSRLGWLGKIIPYEVELGGKKCRLHEQVWELVNKDPLSEADKNQIDDCITLISKKEGEDEQKLKESSLTSEEANELFKETAGLLRAITELKDIESEGSGEKREQFQRLLTQNKVADAKRWVKFLKEIRG